MKLPIKKELQQISFNHLSNVRFDDFMKQIKF